MKDVRLLGERVRKLQTHFGQANEDIANILTSTGRIEKRADQYRGTRLRRRRPRDRRDHRRADDAQDRGGGVSLIAGTQARSLSPLGEGWGEGVPERARNCNPSPGSLRVATSPWEMATA